MTVQDSKNVVDDCPLTKYFIFEIALRPRVDTEEGYVYMLSKHLEFIGGNRIVVEIHGDHFFIRLYPLLLKIFL